MAAAPSPPGFALVVEDAGLLSSLRSAVGAKDVELGDPPFDEARVVRTSDEDLPRRWLNRRLRATLLRTSERVRKLDRDVLTVKYAGLEKSSRALVELARDRSSGEHGWSRPSSWRATCAPGSAPRTADAPRRSLRA
ncbi:MAG: hypothetical protein WKG00_13830 [Polyangiaceae bacterium]